jgi:hypothetical protein
MLVPSAPAEEFFLRLALKVYYFLWVFVERGDRGGRGGGHGRMLLRKCGMH